MKCLPRHKVTSAIGNVLHDSHAEVLALRSFNRFLLEECLSLTNNGASLTSIVALPCVISHTLSDNGSISATPLRNDYPFRIRDGLKLHMYCSEAPCGDASMELTMAAQDDPTPWDAQSASNLDAGSVCDPSADHADILHGRGYFGRLGVVRRKPSRPDAPATLSKSCSDKLALKQCTSVLSSLTSLFIDPSSAYLDSLVLPEGQHVASACQRSFSINGRMKCLIEEEHSWRDGYGFHPFTIKSTSREFAYSRRPTETPVSIVIPSNIAAIGYGKTQETLINGVLQGRKQSDPKGASSLSRQRMLLLAQQLAKIVISDGTLEGTYAQVKQSSRLTGRTRAKVTARNKALTGWARNDGDDDWIMSQGCSQAGRWDRVPIPLAIEEDS